MSDRSIGKTPPLVSGLAAAALLAVALLVRLPGYDGRALFVDELWRALLILDPQFLRSYLAPTVETAITSPVYALLVQWVAAFRISPDTLRLPSLLPGLLACPLAFALSRKAGGGLVLSFLAGLFFALNGNFIAFSNQMKPYMFEVCVHLACLYAWLMTIRAPRPGPRVWTICLLTLTLAVFSTPTAVFLLPAFGLSLFVRFLRDGDTTSLKICILGFAGLSIVVAALYVFSWRHGVSGDMLSIWAAGFPAPGEHYVPFLATHLFDMWQAAFQFIVAERLLAALILALLAAIIGWAFITGAIRQGMFRDGLLFYAVLLVTLCLVNSFRIWPLGALRPNQFLYAHMIFVFFLLAAQVSVPRQVLQICAACAALAFLLEAHAYADKLNLPGLHKRLTNYSAPIEPSDRVVDDFSAQGLVGKSIAATCPAHKTALFAEGVMTMAIHYETGFDTAHRQSAALLDSNCVQLVTIPEAYSDPNGAATALSKSLPPGRVSWFLYTHLDDSEVAALRRVAGRFGDIRQARQYGDAGYFELAAGTHAMTKATPDDKR